MKPVDPRLLRHARATRWFLAASVALGLAGAGLVIAQAVLVADVVVGAFQHGRGLGALTPQLLALAGVAAGRGLVAWLTELAAHRASAAVKSELRLRLLRHATGLGPQWLGGQRSGELVALATRGVDALDDYFARYLPQLALAVVVPVAVLARIVLSDWLSAAIIAGTLPLIPVFMALIGWATQSRMDRQWQVLGRLSHHFLDVVAGLPTLKVFGRAKAQAASVRRITDQYRRATLRTLRIAFVSSFALELLSTVSVALVAVAIGMRLVNGDMGLATGLTVLVLAPEAYLPIRQVGTHYHASVEGLAAAEQIFAVLETPAPVRGAAVPPADPAELRLAGLTVRHPDAEQPVFSGLTLTVRRGEAVALTGPSGIGKSTVLAAVLGFAPAEDGAVRLAAGPDDAGAALTAADPELWRARIAWVPQQPHLFAGTIAENVALARPDATAAQLRAALEAAHAWEFVAALPQREATVLGDGGRGLSAGQRQRLALARAFLADRPVVLLDEPTANLDGESEAAVVAAVRALAVGRTVLFTAHRPALLAAATRVVPLASVAAIPAAAGPAVEPVTVRQGVLGDGTVVRPEAGGGSAGGEGAAAVAARPSRARLALSVLLGSGALLCATALMGTSGWLISRASQMPPVLYLMVAVTAVRAFGIGRSFFRYLERLVSHDAVLRALGVLRAGVYQRLERLAPNGGAGLFHRGDLLSRVVSDVDAIQDDYLRARLPRWAALASGAATVGLVAWLLPEAGAALAAGLLLAGLAVPRLALALSLRAERAQAAARGRLSEQVLGLLDGAAELTAAGALPRRHAALAGTDAELTALQRRSAAGAGLGLGLGTALTGLTSVACGALGVAAVASGRLHGVVLAVLLLTPLAAFEGVTGLTAAAQASHRSREAAARLAELAEAPAPVREPLAAAELPLCPLPLTVRGLTASWPGRQAPALAGVDLELRPGRRVAVVGPSGSGKTTLAQVLLRFLDPEAGSVTLNGVDAAALPSDAVRRAVGLCAQDAHVFDSSLRENLRLARTDATEEQLWAALAAARLDGWVRGLPQGLDTPVGEHGGRLSGGQRQRLALARALLADFPALILDEPAEHLDLATADALTRDLLAATEGRTTLLITHRLAGLDAVDEILVLDHGRIVQRGTWAELTTAPGPFHTLWTRERATDALLAEV